HHDEVFRGLVRVSQERNSQVTPGEFAVTTAKPSFDVIGLAAAAQGLLDLVEVDIEIGQTHGLLKCLAQEHVAAIAEDLAQASIDAQPLSVCSNVRNPDGRLLERGTELLLTLVECHLRNLLGGDVAEKDTQIAAPGWLHTTSDPVLGIRTLPLKARHNAVGSSPFVWVLDGAGHLRRKHIP